MTVKYSIEVPNEFSTSFWKLLTENFNVVLTKRQHSADGEILYIELEIKKIMTILLTLRLYCLNKSSTVVS